MIKLMIQYILTLFKSYLSYKRFYNRQTLTGSMILRAKKLYIIIWDLLQIIFYRRLYKRQIFICSIPGGITDVHFINTKCSANWQGSSHSSTNHPRYLGHLWAWSKGEWDNMMQSRLVLHSVLLLQKRLQSGWYRTLYIKENSTG